MHQSGSDKTKERAHARNTIENMKGIENYRTWFQHQKAYTRNKNARKLKTYCEFVGKTPEQLLREYEEAEDKKAWQRDTRNSILKFYNWLKEQGYAINTARTVPLGILSFYSSHAESIPHVTKEFDAVQIPTNEHAFSQDDLRKMFYYGDTEEKALLSTAVSLGYSSIDFLQLETEKISNLVQEAKDKHLDFIGFIGKSRAKTSVQPRSFLTPEAIDSLSEYLELLKKKYSKLPKYIWSSNSEDRHITNQGLNKKIKRLVGKANIKTYGKQIKFHCVGRKFLYSRLQAKNRDIAKVITGKKVSSSDITYIPNLDAECERIFRETYEEICLNGDMLGKARKQQEERIQELERKIEAQNLLIRTVLGAYGVDEERIEKAKAIAKEKGFLAEFEPLIEA